LPQAPEDFIHRVGRTGRAGASGTASTFGTRSERTEIGRIEKLINIKMIRQEVSADLQRETRTSEVVEEQPTVIRHRQAPAKPAFRGASYRPSFGGRHRRVA
jgi:ATP-dependent RNA helicase RhlE